MHDYDYVLYIMIMYYDHVLYDLLGIILFSSERKSIAKVKSIFPSYCKKCQCFFQDSTLNSSILFDCNVHNHLMIYQLILESCGQDYSACLKHSRWLKMLSSKHIANNTGNYKIQMNINLLSPFKLKKTPDKMYSEFLWGEGVSLVSCMMIPSNHVLHTLAFW